MLPLRKEDETQLVREFKMEKDKIVFKGSHPDSLYRVSAGSSAGAGKVARALRLMRWPAALILVCVALAVFVYFLMPDNIETDLNAVNGTYWEQVSAGAGAQVRKMPAMKEHAPDNTGKATTISNNQGTKTSEIDFYDADMDKNVDITSVIDSAVDTSAKRKLPIPPVFPAHITPEVQYGNEKADSEKLRTAKILEDSNTLPDDSTLKPHITQKPEKPLAVYFKDGDGITMSASTETIAKAETLNEFSNYGEKQTTRYAEGQRNKPASIYNTYAVPQPKIVKPAPPVYEKESDIPLEIQEFYYRRPSNVDVNFTSGHSKLFGISIEDAEKMHSTTQSSTYNTRVSPTLPTWRDVDDSTTKKYPVNVNYDVPQCGSTRLAMCRGILPYDLAGSPVTIDGVEISTFLAQIEFLIASNCSERVQHFMCALLEPECNPPPYPPKMPCYNLCRAISDSCEGLVPRELLPVLTCNQYSSSNCVASRGPCFEREFGCGDNTCIPRDWVCDGAADCPAGEDEAKCVTCQTNEFKCPSGGCVLKRWLCDGYADCPRGEDEIGNVCEAHGVPIGKNAAPRSEPGEESAGSAPAPAVRRPFRIPPGQRASDRAGEAESSKELLMTSDSTNALKRNFTRRPSLSRLTPYSRSKVSYVQPQETPEEEKPAPKRKPQYSRRVPDKKPKPESVEDVNMGDLGFFDDVDKAEDMKQDDVPLPPESSSAATPIKETELTHLDKTINKLEKVIDGAALLRKAAAQQDPDSLEANSTAIDKDDLSGALPPSPVERSSGGIASMTAHASPCPSGELRCVDGRCITLAQLCDGTIDCFDHADEDNCYT